MGLLFKIKSKPLSTLAFDAQRRILDTDKLQNFNLSTLVPDVRNMVQGDLATQSTTFSDVIQAGTNETYIITELTILFAFANIVGTGYEVVITDSNNVTLKQIHAFIPSFNIGTAHLVFHMKQPFFIENGQKVRARAVVNATVGINAIGYKVR